MATLLGDATLTTTTSTSTTALVGTRNVNKQQTSEFRKPRAILPDPTDPNDLVRSGSFRTITDSDLTEQLDYVEGNYAQDDLSSDIATALIFNTSATPIDTNSPQLITDHFVFDFNEIQELSTASIDSITVRVQLTTNNLFNTSTPFSAVSSADFYVHDTSFGLTTSSGDEFGGPQTITVGQTQTLTYTCTDSSYIGTSHSGSFQPFRVQFESNKIGNVTITAVEMKVTYTGKTLLPGPYVENDSIVYVQKDSGGNVINNGSTNGGILSSGGSDELQFKWNAGRFSIPAGTVVQGIDTHEYISLLRGQGLTATSHPYGSTLFTELESGTGDLFPTVEAGQYTMYQDGVSKGNVLPSTNRNWQVDEFASDRKGRDAIARPNLLVDHVVSNLNTDDISTAIEMRIPYASADTTALSVGDNQFNDANEFEFINGTQNSPTGNSGYKDTYSSDIGFDDANIHYRASVLPNATQNYLRFFFAPTVQGQGALDSVFSKSIGTTGVTHGMSASDMGTHTASFTQVGQGGFVLEGSVTMASSFSFTPRGGFQLSVIESESTSATMTVEARLAIRAEATPSSAFTLTDDVDLFKNATISPVNLSFTETFGLLGVTHGMTQTDIGILPSSMTVVAVGDSLPPPDSARIFILSGAETRTVPVNTETRTVETVSQTLRDGLARIIVHNTETRTLTAEQQTRILKIKGYSG